jgi:acyl carrier protein
MSTNPTSEAESLDATRALILRHLRAANDNGGDSEPELGKWEVSDSIMLAEVIATIEDEKGIEVPMNDMTARALRSIDSFAVLIHQLLAAQRGRVNVA